jgi:hypothetical protein
MANKIIDGDFMMARGEALLKIPAAPRPAEPGLWDGVPPEVRALIGTIPTYAERAERLRAEA